YIRAGKLAVRLLEFIANRLFEVPIKKMDVGLADYGVRPKHHRQGGANDRGRGGTDSDFHSKFACKVLPQSSPQMFMRLPLAIPFTQSCSSSQKRLALAPQGLSQQATYQDCWFSGFPGTARRAQTPGCARRC